MDIAIDFIEPRGIVETSTVRNDLQTEKLKSYADELKIRKEEKLKRKEQKKKDRKEKKSEKAERKKEEKQLRKNGKLDNTEIDVSFTTIKHSPDENISFLGSQNLGNDTISEIPSANLPSKEFSDNVKNVKINKKDGVHIISQEYVKNLIKNALEARENSPEAKLSKPIPLSIVTSTKPNMLLSTIKSTTTTGPIATSDKLMTNVLNEPQVSPTTSEFTTRESNQQTTESTTTKDRVTQAFSTLLPKIDNQTSKPIAISTTERTQHTIPRAEIETKTEQSSETKTREFTTVKSIEDAAITTPELTTIKSTEVENQPKIITTNVTKTSTTIETTTEMKTLPEIKTINVTKQTTNVETITILPSTVSQELGSTINNTSSTFTAKNVDTKVPDDELDIKESSNTIMINMPEEAHSGSGSVFIQENKNSNSTKADDIDIIIFPSTRADKRRRKQERRRFCSNIDFEGAKKGFQCCKKTLNCFDELPDDLDETVFHNGQRQYNEAERLHVCHHIDEALICQGDVFTRTVCKDVNPIMEGKIKPQLDKVKLFYYNHCNRGTAITPTGGYPSHKPHPHPHVPPTVPGGTGSEQYHSHTNSYAPYIGGAIMGVFALVIIVLFAIYCRKRVNKRKRNKEQRNDPGRESTQSSRYKTVSYNRRKSDVYAEIDEKSMISSVSYNIDGHSCSTDVTNLNHSNTSSFSRKYQSAPSIRQLELDNHGYLSPESILPADVMKTNIEDENTSTHGYIELNSELGDSGQSYAKLEPEPEDEYIQADEIESTPNKKKKPDEQGHMYFVLEKENEEYDKVLDQ
ncbi:uncharacterized protein LOC134726309 isoform X1 [Mytilus trossulus]|uniref:uncharacterized protein LOC134726309 isoform X1 n=1 Tax=Mytilus trossulus TaxID=6551 RepID=UPI003003C1A5